MRSGEVLRLDGQDDILFDAGGQLPHLETAILGDDVICTGLARAQDGICWIAKHGGNVRDPALLHYSADFSERQGQLIWRQSMAQA